jgi:hypothetical protein
VSYARADGWFWLPGNPEDRAPGWVDLTPGVAPFLTLNRPLLPVDGVAPTARVEGQLFDGRPVQIFEATVTTMIGGLSGYYQQGITATYALLGPSQQVEPGGPAFSIHTFRLDGLNALTAAPIDLPRLSLGDGVLRPTALDAFHQPVSLAPFEDGTVSLTISERVENRSDGSDWRWKPAFQFEFAEPRELAWVEANIVRPLASLLALAAQHRVECTGWEAGDRSSLTPFGPRHSVHAACVHPGLGAPSRGGNIVTVAELGLERIGPWLDRQRLLGGVTRAIVAARDDSARPEPNRFLEAATAVEGLHRRLDPQARRLTDEEHQRLLNHVAAIEPASLGEFARARLQHAHEPTFKDRLRALAGSTADAAPGLTGRTNRWAQAVVDARNGFAHHLDKTAATDDELLAGLQETITWLVTAVLLLDIAVDSDSVHRWLSRSPWYKTLQHRLRTILPSIYKQAQG